METRLIFLFIILISTCSFGQTIDTCEIYDTILQERFNKVENRTVIEFNFEIPNISFEKTIYKLDLFNSKDKSKIIEVLSTGAEEQEVCNNIETLLEKLKSKPYKKSTFNRINYSKPIIISKERVVVFIEVLLKHKEYSGVKGGGIFMEMFSLKKDQVKFLERKTLEVY